MGDERPIILVVDDDLANLDLLQILLGDLYRAITAKNGEEALTLALCNPKPDLILLDVGMAEMSGFDVCRVLKTNPVTRPIPVIFMTGSGASADEAQGFALGAVDFLHKPFSRAIFHARIRTHLSMANQNRFFEDQVKVRTAALEETEEALRKAMGNLLTIDVTPGVYWLQIPEADLRILCGCPGEVVKFLMRKGLNTPAVKDGVSFETGPNAILLSDLLIQNGGFSNLAEFPVLQMLYRQGMMLPGHPNNTGQKPLLMGSSDQVAAQMEYIHRGNYGLISKDEIMATGIDDETADIMMRIKLKFAFGEIKDPDHFLDTLEVSHHPKEIRGGVFVQRIGFNQFRFSYRGKSADIDLTLPKKVTYRSPYPLLYSRVNRYYFAVLHTGEGNGWDSERPCMSSVLMFQGRIYLIDAPPGILNSLTALGIDISEVEGIFHTHAHDDHFAGLPDLIRTDRRIKYYSTPLVRNAVTRKFSALMSLHGSAFEQFFDIHDLTFDTWNKVGGLEVKPIFSPHPVETNIFLFRALDGNGYRTYAHWADILSFRRLEKMAGNRPEDIPYEYIETIKGRYLTPAELKKLDVDGGAIHGDARDFRHDTSGRLILAHLERPLTPEEMEIGSESSFGAIDILIPGEQDHFRQRAFYCFNELFPDTSDDELRMLINGPLEMYNARSIVRRGGAKTDVVEMVVAGNVLYLDAEMGIQNDLKFGSFMGLSQIFGDTGSGLDSGTYRAISHVTTIRISVALFKIFLENNGLFHALAGRLGKIHYLRCTWLFGEQTSFAFLSRLSQSLELITIHEKQFIEVHENCSLWLVVEGCILMTSPSGELVEPLIPGRFFGEDRCLHGGKGRWRFQASEPTRLYRLPWDEVSTAPIIYWKLLEIDEKRKRHMLDTIFESSDE